MNLGLTHPLPTRLKSVLERRDHQHRRRHVSSASNSCIEMNLSCRRHQWQGVGTMFRLQQGMVAAVEIQPRQLCVAQPARLRIATGAGCA